jgi:hypothetical protein
MSARHRWEPFEAKTGQRGARLCLACLAYERAGRWAGTREFVGSDGLHLELNSRSKMPPCPGGPTKKETP